MRGMTSTTWAPPKGKPATHPITVGAIFVNSWGYDQTNVDAYQVVAVTRASVKVRRIATGTVERSEAYMSARVIPRPGAFISEKIHTKRPYEWDGRWYLKSDYGSCSLWDGVHDYHCSWGH